MSGHKEKHSLLFTLLAAAMSCVVFASCSVFEADISETTEETSKETVPTVTESRETTKETTVETTTETTAASSEEQGYTIDLDHGSAVTPEGNVLIFSIFADDNNSSWDYSSDEDLDFMDEINDQLRVATEYLEEQVGRYGKEVSFIYDWEENDGLIYKTTFDHDISNLEPGWYSKMDNWILYNIETEELVEQYDADNVIYMFFFNTDYSCETHSCTIDHACGDYILNEFSIINMKHNGYDMTNASIAHEILHSFGAPDLYYANELIPEEYVQELKDSDSDDIMFTVSISYEIVNDFTDLDAYYVGIAPRPEVADEWSLGESEHEFQE